jgi:hypothetical protein
LNVSDGHRLIEDPQGIELPSADVACEAFRQSARELFHEAEWREKAAIGGEFHVIDELGRTVLVIPFSENTDQR